jgi:phosphoglycolate phosphatase-like HAD superfamily hydrolase
MTGSRDDDRGEGNAPMTDIDWTRITDLDIKGGAPLPGTSIEVIRPVAAQGARAALFDFDGTLSLIRSGWVEIMVPMMVEVLRELRTGESDDALTRIVTTFVYRLTGKQTIYQMLELAEQVRQRGGVPRDALEYKRMYLDRLWEKIKERVRALEEGRARREDYLVPGSIALLDALKARNVMIFIASGTDEKYASREAALLGLTPYVEGKVHGAVDDYKNFSKRLVIRRIMAEHGFRAPELIGFGDGFVEIENVKEAGGAAIGVATDEPACGRIDAWKRARLIMAGADAIVPNYLEHERLLAWVFGT